MAFIYFVTSKTNLFDFTPFLSLFDEHISLCYYFISSVSFSRSRSYFMFLRDEEGCIFKNSINRVILIITFGFRSRDAVLKTINWDCINLKKNAKIILASWFFCRNWITLIWNTGLAFNLHFPIFPKRSYINHCRLNLLSEIGIVVGILNARVTAFFHPCLFIMTKTMRFNLVCDSIYVHST